MVENQREVGVRLSCYILTYNSARRLDEVLYSVEDVADEIIIIDSGSNDATTVIAEAHGAKVIRHRFENFTAQREFAVAECSNHWVLAIDSDEVLSAQLRQRLKGLKAANFKTPNGSEAFGIRREWYFLGRRIRCFYPSSCPDWPPRLFDRSKAHYVPGRHVHEALTGFSRSEAIDEPLLHYACDTVDDLYGKLNRYSTLAARDLAARKISPSWTGIVIYPWLIWFHWYVLKGGWRDGIVGFILGRYTRDMVYQKYLKLKFDIDMS
jgi:glycosyltransferase involved in cell wall biosynthesis